MSDKIKPFNTIDEIMINIKLKQNEINRINEKICEQIETFIKIKLENRVKRDIERARLEQYHLEQDRLRQDNLKEEIHLEEQSRLKERAEIEALMKELGM